MDEAKHQISSRYYAKSAVPLDEDKGWQLEDIQLAFMAGMRESATQRLISVKEAADRLCVSSSTLRGLIRSGDLAYVKLGAGTQRTHVLICPDDIESLIKRSRRHSVDWTRSGVKTLSITGRAPKGSDGSVAQRVERIRAKRNSKLVRSETHEVEAKKKPRARK